MPLFMNKSSHHRIPNLESHCQMALMESINRRAIGEGALSPASHFCTRILETPSRRAKTAWLT